MDQWTNEWTNEWSDGPNCGVRGRPRLPQLSLSRGEESLELRQTPLHRARRRLALLDAESVDVDVACARSNLIGRTLE